MISIVIPLYNKENTIARALDSVLAQTYQDFEVVVVDDGSTDGGVAVVEQYTDPRIRLIRQANAGVSAARNRGIAEAKGEYVAFLDADDEWMPEFLEEIVVLQHEFPACKAQATNYIFNSYGVKSPTILRKIPFQGERGVLTNYFEVAYCSHPPVCSICVCIQRTLLQDIGGFPLGIRSGEDLLTWARIAVRTQWAYSMKTLAQYNLNQLSFKETPTRVPEEVDVVGIELIKMLEDFPRMHGLRKYLSLWHKMRSSIYMRLGYKKDCAKEAMLSLRYNPLNYKVYAYLILNVLGIYRRK
ncbi:MAG: glycosyltransferase [Bacteroidaceae bacterium]|nr:glycosyltransferase [Bacteroidaceae bacterium]